jgi:hypothetical protein
MAKIEGTARKIMLLSIRAKIDEGCKKEEIIKYINKKFNVNYRVGSYRALRREAVHGMNLQERQVPYMKYMEKCRA